MANTKLDLAKALTAEPVNPEADVGATSPHRKREEQSLRLAKIAALAIAFVGGGGARLAFAEDTITLRGVYYKERATRVVQPMLDAGFEVGERGRIEGHLLLDAITSASAAAGSDGDAFSERRYEGGLGYSHLVLDPDQGFLSTLRLGASGRVSSEPDYRSIFASVRADAELAEKNFVVGVGGALGSDNISNAGLQGIAPAVAGEQTTQLVSASVSQLLSPNLVVAVTYDVSRLSGFQENPYRSAVTLDGLVMERHPDKRMRHAVAGSNRLYVPATRTTLIAAYRFYADSWGVTGHTPEVRAVQEAGDSVEFGARYRYHRQSAADFFQSTYPSSDPEMFPYVSDDPKLSRFTSHTMEAKLAVSGDAFSLPGRWGGVRIEGLLQYAVQYNRFGNAVVGQLALTVPLEE